MKLKGILVGKYGIISRAIIEDDWQEQAKAIGCQYVEYPRRHLGDLCVVPICDEEFHARERYYIGAPVIGFDDGDIFGSVFIVKPGKQGRLKSLNVDEEDAVIMELGKRIRRIGEGMA